MQQALDLIRTSLSEYFPKGEIEGFIRLIFDDLCGFSTTDLLLKRDMKQSDDMHEKIVSIVERLKSNEPIQYILGHAYWGDFSLSVGPGVLIPRPETAEIVRRVIAEVGDVDGRVADICTGSGCIAIALSRAWRNAAVEGWDFSQKALAYARRNAVEHQAKVEWIEQDVLSYRPSQEPKYKVMVSNPPYVLESEKREMDENVLCYEPHDALFVSDDDPLLFYRTIAHIAQCELLSGGFLYFEINSKMSKECCELLQLMGFVSVQAFEDYRGMYRMVRAIKK